MSDNNPFEQLKSMVGKLCKTKRTVFFFDSIDKQSAQLVFAGRSMLVLEVLSAIDSSGHVMFGMRCLNGTGVQRERWFKREAVQDLEHWFEVVT